MSKRSLLISLLAAVNIAIVAAVARRVYHTRQARIEEGFVKVTTRSAMCGLFELEQGITTNEIEDAIDLLVQERQMWSQLNGVSANMSVEFEGNDGKRLSLEGNAFLRRVDSSPAEREKVIAKYEMTLSDKRGGWKVGTDGTSENTVTTCQNPQVFETLKTIAPSILRMLTFPHDALVSLYKDDLNPQARYTFSNMLKIWRAWRILHSNNAPHSYTFFDLYGKYPSFTFRNGHIYRWREADRLGEEPYYKVAERVVVLFESPVKSNGFWYPTVMRMTPAPVPWPYPHMVEGFLERDRTVRPAESNRTGRLRITLSNVTVITAK